MEHTEAVHKSLDRYFSTLETVGYTSQNTVKSLLIYLFIIDVVLEGQLQNYLNDDDLDVINRLLSCLANSGCVISRARVCESRLSRPRGLYLRNYSRITEDDTVRITEDSVLRSTETGTTFKS